jgi:hypothetical protein
VPVLAVMLLFAGCASRNMDVVSPDRYVTRPSADKALIFFIRATSFGGAVQAAIYDDTQFVGTISANTHIAYMADPGKHMFMVTGESADFMEADLAAGKTYYADVVPRMGVWKARFSFRPHNGQVDKAEEERSLSGTKQVALNPEGIAWSQEHRDDAQQLKNKYLPEWESKPSSAKQILRSESGR